MVKIKIAKTPTAARHLIRLSALSMAPVDARMLELAGQYSQCILDSKLSERRSTGEIDTVQFILDWKGRCIVPVFRYKMEYYIQLAIDAAFIMGHKSILVVTGRDHKKTAVGIAKNNNGVKVTGVGPYMYKYDYSNKKNNCVQYAGGNVTLNGSDSETADTANITVMNVGSSGVMTDREIHSAKIDCIIIATEIGHQEPSDVFKYMCREVTSVIHLCEVNEGPGISRTGDISLLNLVMSPYTNITSGSYSAKNSFYTSHVPKSKNLIANLELSGVCMSMITSRIQRHLIVKKLNTYGINQLTIDNPGFQDIAFKGATYSRTVNKRSARLKQAYNGNDDAKYDLEQSKFKRFRVDKVAAIDQIAREYIGSKILFLCENDKMMYDLKLAISHIQIISPEYNDDEKKCPRRAIENSYFFPDGPYTPCPEGKSIRRVNFVATKALDDTHLDVLMNTDVVVLCDIPYTQAEFDMLIELSKIMKFIIIAPCVKDSHEVELIDMLTASYK